MKTRIACCAVLALGLAAPAHAQDNPRMIPSVLATAVFGGFAPMGLTPHFVVGRAPADWPRPLMPGATWKVVGGLEMGEVRMLALEAPRTRDIMSEYAAIVTRAGLKENPFLPEMGGFEDRRPMHAYCGDSTAVSLMPGDSTARTRSLIVTWAHGENARGCGSSRVEGRSVPLEIPPLRAPTGVTANRSGAGWGRDYVEQSVRVDTMLSTSAVIDHYARQLGAAGWSVGARPLIDGEAAMQRLTSRDRKGEEWQGALVVITSGPQREVTLRMTRPAADYLRAP